MKILVLMPDNAVRRQFLTDKNLKKLAALGEVTLNPSPENYPEAELRALLAEADAVVTGWGCPRVSGTLLGEHPPRILAHTGGTVAPYVDASTYQKGVKVVSANELYAKSVAEGTIAYMLAGLRQIPYWNNLVKAGKWRSDEAHNRGLLGKRVGLTAFGAIPRHLLPLLKAFDTEVLVCSGHLSGQDCEKLGVQKATLEEIFSTCDIISVHNALTEKTHHLIGARHFSMIRDGAVLVNTARGAVLDEEALCKALQGGRFTAVLDVFETEPLRPDSPLRGLDNAILIPHMGGPTADLYEACGAAVIEEIRRIRDGEPLCYEIPASAVQFMTANG